MDHVVIVYGTQHPNRDKILFIGSSEEAKTWATSDSTPGAAITYRVGQEPPLRWPPDRTDEE